MTAGCAYRGWGLDLNSEIGLPELRPAAATGAEISIRIAPEAAQQWRASGATEADGDAFLAAPAGGHAMRVAGIGDYWVRGGCEIAVTPAPGADAASVRLYLLGSAIGMAFHQRGLLVLHGATVARLGRATVFVGDSGAGKSTLAARLGQTGHAILGDDTMPVWPRPGGGFAAWPGSRMFKLWGDAVEALGDSLKGLGSVGDRLDKFFYPNVAMAPDVPHLIDEIIVLEAGAPRSEPVLETLGPLESLRAVAEHTYRPEYVPLLGREAEHFRQCTALAERVSAARLTRPWDIRSLDAAIELLVAHWSRARNTVQAG